MIAAGPRGPVVIDTDVFSADLVPRSWLAEQYAPSITGRPAFISFQTAAELRYGALRRGWGLRRHAEARHAGDSPDGPILAAAEALGSAQRLVTGGEFYGRRFASGQVIRISHGAAPARLRYAEVGVA